MVSGLLNCSLLDSGARTVSWSPYDSHKKLVWTHKERLVKTEDSSHHSDDEDRDWDVLIGWEVLEKI